MVVFLCQPHRHNSWHYYSAKLFMLDVKFLENNELGKEKHFNLKPAQESYKSLEYASEMEGSVAIRHILKLLSNQIMCHIVILGSGIKQVSNQFMVLEIFHKLKYCINLKKLN